MEEASTTRAVLESISNSGPQNVWLGTREIEDTYFLPRLSSINSACPIIGNLEVPQQRYRILHVRGCYSAISSVEPRFPKFYGPMPFLAEKVGPFMRVVSSDVKQDEQKRRTRKYEGEGAVIQSLNCSEVTLRATTGADRLLR